VVLNNRTIHASPPNTSNQVRVAFGIGITDEDAGIRHYYMLPGQQKPTMEAYEVGPEFFYNYNNARLASMHQAGAKPQNLNSLGVFSVTARQYETGQLREALRAAGNQENMALVRKMAGLFENTPEGTQKGKDDESPAARAEAKLPFWKVYTPLNIFREIRYRLSSR
jgi:hypothetical protein